MGAMGFSSQGPTLSASGSFWSLEEEKAFENALATYDKGTPDRWESMTTMVPGKSAMDCRKHYEYLKKIRSSGEGPPAKFSKQERKKGIPWTEEEHRLFLRGLNNYGKGDWRGISRNYVVSRTPMQVAKYAEKYFIRCRSGNKVKRRASILHDISSASGTDRRSIPLPQSSAICGQSNSTAIPSPTELRQYASLMYLFQTQLLLKPIGGRFL